MDYGALTPLLVEAIKELKQEKDVEIEELKEEINVMKRALCEMGRKEFC